MLIHLARGERVLLDADLARLYGVTTGALNRAVKRNANRFPTDFMFQLTADEAGILKCQIGISSLEHGGRRRSLPYAFTEQGVAMLSSVLRSERADFRDTVSEIAARRVLRHLRITDSEILHRPKDKPGVRPLGPSTLSYQSSTISRLDNPPIKGSLAQFPCRNWDSTPRGQTAGKIKSVLDSSRLVSFNLTELCE